MLIAVICIYLCVWGCAYAAAHRFAGRAGFWLFYAVAIAVPPNLSGGVFYLFYANADGGNAAGFARIVILVGLGMAAVFYPASYWRIRRAN